MPSIQEYAKNRIVEELKGKLGTELGIKKLSFQPFNTIRLDSLYAYDKQNEETLNVGELSASVDLFSLLRNKIVITSVQLSNFDIHLAKENKESPLNIQYIIDAFSSDNQNSSSNINLKLNTIHINNGLLSYNIKNQAYKKEGFDANHILVSNLDAKLSLKSLLKDSLNIQVKKIAFKEKSGLEITNLICRFITQNEKVSLKGFRLDLPSSYLEFEKLDIDLTPPNDTLKAKSNILDYATIDVIIAPSYIAPKDISAFTSSLQYFNDLLTLKGQISGTIDDLKAENLTLELTDKMKLLTNAEVKDVRDTKKMYVLGSIDYLKLSKDGVEGIANNFTQNKNTIPKEISRLGNVSFKGDISGYLNRLTAFGNFETELGSVGTEIIFGLNPSQGLKSFLQGNVYTNEFKIGQLLDNKDFDKISLNLSLDLTRSDRNKLVGSTKGAIFNFSYKDYLYKDIAINGSYSDMHYDGNLVVNTANGALSIDGILDISNKEIPEISIRVDADNVELDDLQLVTKFNDSYLNFVANAKLKGKSIDEMVGYISIDTLDFVRGEKYYYLDHFNLSSIKDSLDQHRLVVTSDVINGEVKGNFKPSDLGKSIQNTLYPYLSALLKSPSKENKNKTQNELTFDFCINNTKSISDAFDLPVIIMDSAIIKGSYNNNEESFKVEVSSPYIKNGGKNILSTSILAERESGKDYINANISTSLIGKNEDVNSISILSQLKNNQIDTDILLENSEKDKMKGKISLSTLFSKPEKKDLRIDFNILPSNFLINSTSWIIDQSNIGIYKNQIAINQFNIHSQDDVQRLRIDGKYSNNGAREQLKAQLKNINLEYIFSSLAIQVLKFSGKATGDVVVSSIEGKPYANTNLEINDFGFNYSHLGDLKLYSEFDDVSQHVILDGVLSNPEGKGTLINGYIAPLKEELSLYFDAKELNIGFLSEFTKSIFDKVSGRGSGKVHLYGNFSDVTVEGLAYVDNGNINIPMLNTNYSFSDSISLKKDLIYFNDIEFKDEYGNSATAFGKVSHNYFSDFSYNVELEANNFLVFNSTEAQNPVFFGKVFATGNASIGGDEDAVNIDANMRTEKKTVIRMNFMGEDVNEYNFIRYKEREDTTNIDQDKKIKKIFSPLLTNTNMEVNMNFYVDATADALVEIVMDPIGGDVIQATGSGTIQFLWNTVDAPKLYGTYDIHRGNYNFTFQRLLERRFSIEEGSRVQFSGDPFEAILNVEATYKVNADLSDLDTELAQFARQTSVPVNCILKLDGPLKQPLVALDISVPRNDAEIERQIKNLINTEDMKNRQVAYLLLLSKFYTPHSANVNQKTSDFASVASATLSSQLTKIINQIDKRWQLGTHIKANNAEFTSTEVELILSSQLLNNRLLINGNFGYRDNPDLNINNAFIGDIDVELLLNNSGTWRIKASNHYNDKLYYNESAASQVQSVGIMYKRNFDKVQDLFFAKKKKKENKKDTSKTPDIKSNSFIK